MREELAAVVGSPVDALSPTHGGDINQAFRAELADGRVLFVKTRPGADDLRVPAATSRAPHEFMAEAAALDWLRVEGGLPLPDVAGVGTFLALSWVDEGARSPSFAADLGRGLAAIHRAGAARFGFTPHDGPTRIGPLLLPNAPAASWPEFYAAQRLEPLLRAARDRGGVSSAQAATIQAVIDRLPSLCGPDEPPARLHGDLWTGNVLAGADGRPWLIDPAAYGGHREIDLAMLSLFGSPGEACFAAYDEAFPLAPGWRERVALNQLLPLLVHAALFGGGYGASAAAAAARYAR